MTKEELIHDIELISRMIIVDGYEQDVLQLTLIDHNRYQFQFPLEPSTAYRLYLALKKTLNLK